MNWIKNNKIKTLLILVFSWFGFCVLQVYVFSKEYHDDKSDVAIVLGAGQSNGNLSPIFEERIPVVHLGDVNF